MKKLTPAARKSRVSLLTSWSTFGLGIVVSLGGNYLASDRTILGVLVSVWPPVALLLSMALLENVPMKGRAGLARKIAIGFLAFLAAWASYWHLVDVATDGGADAFVAHTLPLTVDVMIALATPGLRRKPTPAARPARTRKPIAAGKPQLKRVS